MWEAHEVNWHCELCELNLLLTNLRGWMALARWERETAVCRIWMSEGTGLRLFPAWGGTLQASCGKWIAPPEVQWHLSRRTVKEFIHVMQHWPHLPQQLRMEHPDTIMDYDADKFWETMRAGVAFYVCMFIDTFHHLPILPMVLPEDW